MSSGRMRFTDIFIFSVVLTYGGSVVKKGFTYALPCEDKSTQLQSDEFVRRHIIPNTHRFQRDDNEAWAQYLGNQGLCGRVSVQTFIETGQDVNGICGNNGRRLNNAQKYTHNLCISISTMQVYNVKSQKTNNVCTVSSVTSGHSHVTVACNKIGNVCHPVHYESDQGQTPDNVPCN